MIDFGFGGVALDTINYPIAPMIRQWRNDYRIWKWCRQNDLITQDSHGQWADNLKNRKDVAMYAIKDGPICVGVCGLTDIDRINQRAEFSLYIAPEHQGKGFAKPSLATLLSHGFLNQNLNVIWGETFEDNKAYDMFIKLGMKHEGTRREFYFRSGEFIDAHLVSMTRKEFMEIEWRSAQI